MKQVTELTDEERRDVLVAAIQYSKQHPEYVTRLLKDGKEAVPPSGSDIFRPELWKSIHWRWLRQFMCAEFR